MHLTLSSLVLAVISTLLLCSASVTATPARPKKTTTTKTAIVTPAPITLHPCGVVVQRWGLDSWETFDQYYESNGKEFFHQATIGSTTPGEELVPIQVGSNILHIYNTANPVYDLPDGAHDPGKLSFVWGSTKFDSFSPGSPCTNNVFPAVNFTCSFQCDK
ncbi:uncharacterized protein RAG0_11121 [Rhynchosporium agropyri]|uniref:Uncharacterized protein n=1 Tax=Rhynchosporium agropyri TaxID=914238 RepID=A0A1E1L2S1_9HELO|nr:uncharacterized protein RAG0_11121 [Rhynchosporium agropyri]